MFGGSGVQLEAVCLNLDADTSTRLANALRRRGAKPFAGLVHAAVSAHRAVLGRNPRGVVQQARVTVQYSTVQYSTVRYSTVRYSTVQNGTARPSEISSTRGPSLTCVPDVAALLDCLPPAPNGFCAERNDSIASST